MGALLVTEAAPAEEVVTTPVETTDTPPSSGAVGEDTAQVSQPEGTDSGEFSFESLRKDALPERKADAVTPKLPGKSVEEAEAERRQGRARAYYQRLASEGEAAVKRVLTDTGPNGYAIDSDTAAAIWDGVVKPLLNDQHNNYEAFNVEADKATLEAALDEAEKSLYFGREYKGRQESLKGLVAAGYEKANTEWQGKLSREELYTAEDAKTLAKAAFDKGLAQGEGNTSKASSGSVVSGLPAMGTPAEDAQLMDPSVPQSTKDAILRRRGML